MRLKIEDSLLLVIDCQEKLMPVIYEKDQLMKQIMILLEGSKVLGIPMIVTQQYTKGLGMSLPQVQQYESQYYDKTTFSCYGESSIRRALETNGKNTIVVCGVESHICVLQTVLDLLEDGYQVVLAADCIGSRKVYDKEIALKRMEQDGAVITTCESLLFELLKEAGSDTFKQISKIIK